MGIREMKGKKQQLESHMLRLIKEFEESTSLTIEGILIDRYKIRTEVNNSLEGKISKIKVKAVLD